MAHREPFDPKRPLVAAREFIFAGVSYGPGDPFPGPDAGPVSSFPRRLIERQYNTFAVNHGEADGPASDDPIQMTGPKGGRYTITAPWLETPLVVRGKVNAEAALADMREEGPPLGWIDGGSEVEVEELGGGWYQISAPWLEEPLKEQGREAAEAKQRELHEAGAPGAGEGTGEGEGGEAGEGGPEGGSDNSDKSGAENGAGEGVDEGAGTDGAQTGEGAGGAGEAADQADAGEAGQSGADPAAA